MQYVFGPVPSRRLGFSLGVDIIPAKYCTYDCIYCQIGKTTNREIDRRSFFDPQVIINEIIDKTTKIGPVDFITFSGSGEPTLNADLGMLIRELKKNTAIPVAVITNGSLLYLEEVRKDIIEADVVLPSLDAVSEDTFRCINRPHPALAVEKVISGIKTFRKEYSREIWLEIMLIRNINDETIELERMKKIVSGIGAERVQLNTVTRPPSEGSTGRLQDRELARICKLFGPACEIICSFEKTAEIPSQAEWTDIIIETLKRRPLTLEDIVNTTNLSHFQAKGRLRDMEEQGLIKSYLFEDNTFYMAT
ncbi:MAG TPA: radical SAM protein [Syntrophorhabdaceae bacterium]|nr:radical SAM protein [Syntrophorhabdaceae bacterium]